MIGEISAKKIDQEAAKVIDLAHKMWETPETAYNEVNACKWTADLMKEYGFEVKVGAYDLPTCVEARWGHGHPVIGLLGELDALPGMSQKISTTYEPVVYGAPGQGCGHNLLNGATVAAAVGLKAEMEAKGLEGTIVFYGCPAEEELTGKVFMARNGAFTDLDCAFAWHGGTANMTFIGQMTGLNSAVFHFKGRTAHAGGDPYNGRSALDAAELMSVGANYLREHVTSDIRIHYCYKEAGTAPNIVPDKAAVWYYVRGNSRPTIEDCYERLVKVAKGAAMMTETELEIEFLGGCYNGVSNEVMTKLVHEAMSETELPTYTDEELKFADELNKQSPNYEGAKASGQLNNGPIMQGVAPIFRIPGVAGGSSDVADVAHIVPLGNLSSATCNLAAPGHSWQITACAGMDIGHKGMIFGGKSMALAALKLINDPSILEAAKAEFAELHKKEPYKCPIPMDVPVPQPKKV